MILEDLPPPDDSLVMAAIERPVKLINSKSKQAHHHQFPQRSLRAYRFISINTSNNKTRCHHREIICMHVDDWTRTICSLNVPECPQLAAQIKNSITGKGLIDTEC